MYTRQNNSLPQEYEPFLLPAPMNDDFAADDLDEDMDGLQTSFPRVKIPGGGVLQFEMPGDDPDRPSYVSELEGIILFNHASNAHWPEGSEYDDNTPPQCQSLNGKIGYGDPGGLCAACANNAFGSDGKGRGKACKNMRILYLLRSGELMPLQVALPPTSIHPFSDFVNAVFKLRNRPMYSTIVRISLKRASSNGFDYSTATFTKVRDLAGEELARVRAYAAGFREQVKMMLSDQAAAKELEAGSLEVRSAPMALPDNEGQFAVGVINGDTSQLPL